MIITYRPELSPEEKKLPLAKYYDLSLYPPGPREQQIIDACPIDPKLAIKRVISQFTTFTPYCTPD